MLVDGAYAASIADANLKYDAGEFDQAFAIYEELASDNDLFAQLYLGTMYDLGEGVQEDNEQAIFWYTKAAERGLVEAQFYLGTMYDFGDGV